MLIEDGNFKNQQEFFLTSSQNNNFTNNFFNWFKIVTNLSLSLSLFLSSIIQTVYPVKVEISDVPLLYDKSQVYSAVIDLCCKLEFARNIAYSPPGWWNATRHIFSNANAGSVVDWNGGRG